MSAQMRDTEIRNAETAADAGSPDIGELRRQQRRKASMRYWIASAGLLVVAVLAYLVLLGSGAMNLSLPEVLNVLQGGGDSSAIKVVWDLRLPVAIATVIVGAALGLAGSWTQTMARNALASPDILGVSGGAAVLVVWGTVVSRPEFSQDMPVFWWRASLALIGAAIVVVLLLLLGGVGTSNQVVLIGFALSMMAQAIVAYLLKRAELLRAAEAQTWMAGSTGFVRSDVLLPLVLGLAPFVILGFIASRDLPLLAHDDVSALTLGVNIQRVRAMLLIAATGVVAIVVSAVGPIGFVALVAPQVARLITGTPTPQPISSAITGAALITVCAVIAARVPASVPVGLVTSAIGGVVLVYLVWRAAKVQARAIGRS